MHLLKVVFGVESACEIKYTPSSPVSVKNKLTVNKKLTICDWLWENPPVTHKDDYLEKRN